MVKTESFEMVKVSYSKDLRDWLMKNYDREQSVWLVTYKKGVNDCYISTSQILDELLCFGWIDGIRRKLDHERTMQLISPRKAQHWSKTYKDRVDKLQKEGRMHKSGLKSIDASKKNGMWDFLNDVDKLIKPKDLEIELAKKADAQQFFDNLNPSSKRFVLRWLKLAKTEKTRTKRINEIVSLSSKGRKLPGS
ncbi:MAG: YdeI/OmpD-associated family protein [Ekhidna sp.]|nr:YdeI/OmpD-associated family protein [Ekhidna sp.]